MASSGDPGKTKTNNDIVDENKTKVDLEQDTEETPGNGEDNDKNDDSCNACREENQTAESQTPKKFDGVVYKFRDIKQNMVEAWDEAFEEYIGQGIETSKGDIFRGGPACDALVSPANSFGFMDGGIDMAYSRHFGWQMQERLQSVIIDDFEGENLVGNAIIIPAYDKELSEAEREKLKGFNEGVPIKYMISAPTMRVPMDISETVNAYLAFRAVILAVQKHNRQTDVEPIRSVLCPGLGTAVGMMPKDRCAAQMLKAYETYELKLHQDRICPRSLFTMVNDHDNLISA